MKNIYEYYSSLRAQYDILSFSIRVKLLAESCCWRLRDDKGSPSDNKIDCTFTVSALTVINCVRFQNKFF